MNLVYAEIVEIFIEEGMQMGRVRIGGAVKAVSLDLLTDPKRGDTILLADGVAISKVVPGNAEEP